MVSSASTRVLESIYAKARLQSMSLTLQDTLITIVATLGAALGGALFGSWTATSFQVKNSQRRGHQNDIKKDCLLPLAKSLNNFFLAELWFTEDKPQFPVAIVDPASKQIVSPAPYIPTNLLTMSASFEGLDRVLYEDLANHYPELAQSSQEFDSGVAGKFQEYKKVLYETSSKIVLLLREKRAPTDGLSEYEKFQMLTRAVIFSSIKRPVEEWPNLHQQVLKEAAIVNELANTHEISELSAKVKTLHDELLAYYDALKQRLELAIDSYKSLKGSCSLID